MIDAHDAVLLEDEFLDAAKELREIAAEKKALAEREAECKRILEKVLTVGEKGVAPDGEPLVQVRRGARVFKAALAAQNLDDDTFKAIITFQPDGDLARQILRADLYDLCCAYNKASVVAV